MQGVMTIKIPVPVLAEALMDQIGPLNPNGDYRYFCKLLQDHYGDQTVEVPTTAKAREIAAALRKLTPFSLAAGPDRRLFNDIIERLSKGEERIELEFADAN